MNRKITFRSMDHSDIIENYINKKLDKFDKFFKDEQGPVSFEVVLEAHRIKNYFIVEVRLQSREYNFVAQAEGDDMYTMIDEAEHKMMQQVSRAKEKRIHEIDSQPKMK